jgi:RNA polymerase sigma-70 factor (ECF subfamily)
LCINQTVRKKTLLSLDSTGAAGDPLDVPDRHSWRPDQVAEEHELQARIRAGLARLPELQRAAVELRALGMSKEEIATVLDVSANYAGVLIHRGRQALAALLGLHTEPL